MRKYKETKSEAESRETSKVGCDDPEEKKKRRRKAQCKSRNKSRLRDKPTKRKLKETYNYDVKEFCKDTTALGNPAILGSLIEDDIYYSHLRNKNLNELEDHIHRPATFNNLETKEVITLYGLKLKDRQYYANFKLKLAMAQDQSKLMKEITKLVMDKESSDLTGIQDESRKQLSGLIESTLRESIIGQVEFDYSSSNTVKPIEDCNFEEVIYDEDYLD